MKEDVGDLDAAEALNEQAMALRERLFGPESREVALSWQNIADYRLGRDDLAGAQAAIDAALRIRRREFPEGHFLRVISEATRWIVDANEGRLPPDAPSPDAIEAMMPRVPFNTRLSLLQALAAMSAARGDAEGAGAAVRRELALLRQRHPEGHPLIGVAELRLARAQAAGGDRVAARATLDRAVATIRNTHAANSPWRARAGELARSLGPRTNAGG